jgi:hypothetical protein
MVRIAHRRTGITPSSQAHCGAPRDVVKEHTAESPPHFRSSKWRALMIFNNASLAPWTAANGCCDPVTDETPQRQPAFPQLSSQEYGGYRRPTRDGVRPRSVGRRITIQSTPIARLVHHSSAQQRTTAVVLAGAKSLARGAGAPQWCISIASTTLSKSAGSSTGGLAFRDVNPGSVRS